ncbi:MAG: ion transporter [Lachnospiraceae bacterium]|nr:ion transporter [Lachnospiraceae bacterium]
MGTGLKEVIGKIRKKIFLVIDVNNNEGFANRFYDFFSTGLIILNILVVSLNTVSSLHLKYGHIYEAIEALTVLFFAVDCGFRIWTAEYQHPEKTPGKAILKYILSFDGIIDILSFLPYYLPVVFPAGAVVFRFFRVIRIFRLFRINAYYDSLNVITDVIKSKKNQLVSSVFIILVLMMASSLCMYSVENAAQPDVFSNAFSGLWWAVSTLLTIGYGDIYPVTGLGQALAIVISFLGVGMVAIPTGIISAGFVEQYQKITKLSTTGSEADLHFIKIHIGPEDPWANRQIKYLGLSREVTIAVILRGSSSIIPRGDVVIRPDDIIVLGAEAFLDDYKVELKKVVIAEKNPWNGTLIRDLDISRQTVIVSVKRNGRAVVPKGDLEIRAGDEILLYSQNHMRDQTGVLKL